MPGANADALTIEDRGEIMRMDVAVLNGHHTGRDDPSAVDRDRSIWLNCSIATRANACSCSAIRSIPMR